jgi:hypothetical protein
MQVLVTVKAYPGTWMSNPGVAATCWPGQRCSRCGQSAGTTPRGPGHGLVLRMERWRCQLRAVGVVAKSQYQSSPGSKLWIYRCPTVPVMRTRVLAR